MEKVKNEAKRIWGLAVAHPKISIAVAVVIVAIYFLVNQEIQRIKTMTERFCKNCNKMCHCTDKTKNDCDCDNCQCGSREEDSTYEGGVIIDDTGECESCQ